MGLTVLTLPRLGETMEEARVTDWLVAPGQTYARGDVLLEVETDKTVVEVPALASGVMRAHLVGPGDIVEIGQVIAEVESDTVAALLPKEGLTELPAIPTVVDVPKKPPTAAASAGPNLRASPRARRMAQGSKLDLQSVAGTGPRGRVTGADVETARQVKPRIAGMACDRQAAGAEAGTVLLLHGLFSTRSAFVGLSARLARAGVQVLAPDLPGHGDSPDASGLAQIEGGLADLIDATAPTGDLYLVGHSMGAILATRLACRFGDRVKRLVLLAPAGLGPRMNQLFLDILCNAETPAALRRGMSILGAGPISDAALGLELAMLRKHRASQLALARELSTGGVQQIDIADELDAIATPVRALFGTADAVLDWQDSARLPVRAAIHLRAGAGHLPHLGAEAIVEEMLFG
ncbi:alpha/beta fold hydrolase [Pseudotabrizicola sediminis]|uniref:Alpha/beta fold hydrolase n=1 Tax=Pseudotabrizicola sediminis TaxID=2486418 RepID=A0ABY2KHI0_9RHOB|nr:alpha/beta fold hydrolase [Pseudotabrizicola sediminis]TGD41755.1 alpha/beta fold hydrolase [Pseudotabrizicola sediminis]